MLTRRILGVPVHYIPRQGGWWWRVPYWHPWRSDCGPYPTRQEAIKDSARMLHVHPQLRGRRPLEGA